MALNYPGPYQLRIKYTVAQFDHVLRMNIAVQGTPAPGTLFSAIFPLIQTGSPSASALSAWVDLLVGYLQPLYAAADSTIDSAELWKIDAGSFDGSFVSAYDISVAGTAGGSATAASMEVYVWRSTEGGTMRLTLMETIDQPGFTEQYTDLSAARVDLVDFISGAPTIFLARDTSYPVAFLAMHPGQSEALFKRRYRG